MGVRTAVGTVVIVVLLGSRPGKVRMPHPPRAITVVFRVQVTPPSALAHAVDVQARVGVVLVVGESVGRGWGVVEERVVARRPAETMLDVVLIPVTEAGVAQCV